MAAYIVFPCFIITILSFFFLPEATRWLCVIPLAIGTGVFVIRRGIDEWWYSRHPPGLSDMEKDILNRFFPYYRQLLREHREEFERRVSVFRLQKSFQMRGADKLPGDIQLLVSATAIQLTMGFEYEFEFFKELGMIVLYPRTFISPDINEQHHSVEVNQDRFNCLLLSVTTFVDGLKKPDKFYNSGIYGLAKAFKLEKGIKDTDIPFKDRDDLVAKLHLMRGFPLAYIWKYTGIKEFELFEMCSEHFFMYPKQMQKELPDVYTYLMKIYQQDPNNPSNPIIQSFID